MTEEELLLTDRITKIQAMNEKYDLLNNSYVSFSGGKDSTVLHYLIDIALPGNNIPRVFIDTGIEYSMIRNYVKNLAEHDKRIEIIKPKRNIKLILQKYGYPFKSKEHSHKWESWNKGQRSNHILKYINDDNSFSCPKILKYQFSSSFELNISDRCCYKLKKEPIHKWEKENNKSIAIIGIKTEEGGQRANHHECIVLDKNGKMKKFKPLNPMTDAWEEWFIKKNNIKLCELYYPPFNFKRTGCKGCPYSIELENQLMVMGMYLPNERKQCEDIWKPVYEEYRKIGYRLKGNDLWSNK